MVKLLTHDSRTGKDYWWASDPDDASNDSFLGFKREPMPEDIEDIRSAFAGTEQFKPMTYSRRFILHQTTLLKEEPLALTTQ